jgi:hypothetical protein
MICESPELYCAFNAEKIKERKTTKNTLINIFPRSIKFSTCPFTMLQYASLFPDTLHVKLIKYHASAVIKI